jgi:hypothetical protein
MSLRISELQALKPRDVAVDGARWRFNVKWPINL